MEATLIENIYFQHRFVDVVFKMNKTSKNEQASIVKQFS